ncbi:MAG: tyrosine-protein phosphatase [Deltaproteobacteria bacterium]|nr:tyrosine-protein phosphatase [Deltaproteobacteria bacterium]
MNWVIEGTLARSARPGYPSRYVEKDVVLSSIEYWKSQGIRSVICLMTGDELLYYPEEGDLLDLYHESDLFARVIPVENHKEHPLDASEMHALWTVYQAIEKPVLIHCSAGKDRTGAAVELIMERETKT